MVRVTPPDFELWLTGYVRALAAAEEIDVDVDNVEPDDLTVEMERPLIVLRDDSGPRRDVPTFDRSVGATVLGGSKAFPKPINDIARWLSAVLSDEAIVTAPDSPIASVELDGFNGPYPVNDALDVARRYQTAQYTVVGSW
ncbi:hypothetical protein NS220_02070 [Microbacterium testaceum]|uniref:Uncharacterized protein n=1 Tax=Microbacterium testaceum TaxID=2033 RepID=A0A147F0W1_MICTE|nr:hypothetical protein [Microbacterium testaceum]KTR96483.1 hypothetical protein NS220_02070 [Microbacterium testaceum]